MNRKIQQAIGIQTKSGAESILTVLPYYFPFPGGAERSTHERLRRLVTAGFFVNVLVAPTMPRPGLASQPSLLAALSQTGVVHGIYVQEPQSREEFMNRLREELKSASIIFYSRANILRKTYGCLIDEMMTPYRYKMMYFVHDLKEDDYFAAAVVVANSDAVMQILPNDPNLKSTVLKPVIDLEVIAKPRLRRFITIINPYYGKGGDIFAAVAQCMPHEHFLAQLGSGEPVDGIGDIPNVEIREPAADISDVYAQTSVLMIPSRNEPFGRVAVEGALAGCVVLAHRKGGLCEVPLPERSFVDSLRVDVWTEKLAELTKLSAPELDVLRAETAKMARSYDCRWESFILSLNELRRRGQSGFRRSVARSPSS